MLRRFLMLVFVVLFLWIFFDLYQLFIVWWYPNIRYSNFHEWLIGQIIAYSPFLFVCVFFSSLLTRFSRTWNRTCNYLVGVVSPWIVLGTWSITTYPVENMTLQIYNNTAFF